MINHYLGSEAPSWGMWIYDPTGALLNLAGEAFTGTILDGRTLAVVHTLTGTFTGATGAGVEPTGTPNLVYVPDPDEMVGTVPPGVYRLRVVANIGDAVVYDGPIRVRH